MFIRWPTSETSVDPMLCPFLFLLFTNIYKNNKVLQRLNSRCNHFTNLSDLRKCKNEYTILLSHVKCTKNLIIQTQETKDDVFTSVILTKNSNPGHHGCEAKVTTTQLYSITLRFWFSSLHVCLSERILKMLTSLWPTVEKAVWCEQPILVERSMIPITPFQS